MEQVIYHSPIGILRIESFDGLALDSIVFVDDTTSDDKELTGHLISSLFSKTKKQLDAYFKGALQQFHLPLHMDTGPFTLSVWRALQAIPYGATISYGELAERVNEPKAARAVGHANSCNPFAIVVPCHRVVGAREQLVGYRWGLERKRWLLEHEKRYSGQTVELSLF
ncbi:MAG: methylated-DNA--[protein]-cysteine S-methyltransferase [Bacteroidales bacterium]|nr:methylated-DNA--[protein]-cysteine S-methyltransferase [Bacteroidales bacterium]MCL2133441.1 methylated-DNA--[protein]-cysteine S-methyltransferase [Bacteroidales bacterium]